MVRITQQRGKCIGCNVCAEVAMYRWRISRKDGKCSLVGANEKKGFYSMSVGDDEWDDAHSAAKHCPVNIIKVEQIK